MLIRGQHTHFLSYYHYIVIVSINFGYISTFLRKKLCFLGAVGPGATKFSTMRRDANNEVVFVIAGVYCNTVRWVIRIITSPTFSLPISRLWYLFEMYLVNQPRSVSEPTHVVPIRPCHDVYSSLQCSHRHRHRHRHRHSCLNHCQWPSYRVLVSLGCGYFI